MLFFYSLIYADVSEPLDSCCVRFGHFNCSINKLKTKKEMREIQGGGVRNTLLSLSLLEWYNFCVLFKILIYE